MALTSRWMIRRDLPAVLTIESATGGDWDEAEFLRRLSWRKCWGKVVESDDRIVGFVLCVMHRDRLEVVRLSAFSEAAVALMREYVREKARYSRRKLVRAKSRLFRMAPAWRTETVTALAANRKAPAPILADALQDAGCDCESLLAALRADGRLGHEARGMVAVAV